MLKVAKFGGTSLADVASIKQVLRIIDGDSEISYVVVSAPGKRNSDDEKITDMLCKCYDDVICGISVEKALKPITGRFREIARGFGLKIDMDALFLQFKTMLIRKMQKDYAISRGEYFMAKILSDLLSMDFLDADKIIKFDRKGYFDEKATSISIQKELNGKKRVVIPGFYGAMPDGEIKTFGRGGSDVTGAAIAKCLNAEIYENWTDVDGVMVCDPKVVGFSKHIRSLNYVEMLALANYGATVVHPDAIKILLNSETSIRIKNTFNLAFDGTIVSSKKVENEQYKKIVGISGEKGFFSILIHNADFVEKNESTQALVSALEDNGFNVENVNFCFNSVSVIVRDNGVNEETLCGVLDEISVLCSAKRIEFIRHFAIIAVVESGIVSNFYFMEELFGLLKGYDIMNVSPGINGACLLILLPESECESCMRAICETFAR